MINEDCLCDNHLSSLNAEMMEAAASVKIHAGPGSNLTLFERVNCHHWQELLHLRLVLWKRKLLHGNAHFSRIELLQAFSQRSIPFRTCNGEFAMKFTSFAIITAIVKHKHLLRQTIRNTRRDNQRARSKSSQQRQHAHTPFDQVQEALGRQKEHAPLP